MILFQVGGFFEFYDGQAKIAMGCLGLKNIAARRGLRARCGFPTELKERYMENLMQCGFAVHVVEEVEGWLSIRKRQLAEGRSPKVA